MLSKETGLPALPECALLAKVMVKMVMMMEPSVELIMRLVVVSW